MSAKNRGLTPVHIRLDKQTIKELDRFIEEQERRQPGAHYSRVQAARVFLMRGIACNMELCSYCESMVKNR